MLLEDQDDYVIKDYDGKEIYKVKREGGLTSFRTMQDEVLCAIGVDARFSYINGVECLISLPHMYIYALKPFKEGTPASEFKMEGQPLFFWARVHKDEKRLFHCNMARHKTETAVPQSASEMFSSETLALTTYKPPNNDKMAVTRIDKGACVINTEGEDWVLHI